MEFKNLQLEDVIVLEDKKRKPLSTMDRSKRKGIYPYYGAQEIIDSIDDYIFDGEYLILNTGGTAFTNYVNGKFSAMSDCLV